MATRYILRPDNDGSYSIIDIFTGLVANYAGRALTRIPVEMADSGLRLINELDATRRASEEKPILHFRWTNAGS